MLRQPKTQGAQMGEESPNRVSTPIGAVFLSYASQDADAARRIGEALRAAGIEVWFDQSELRGGDVWDQKIRRQIRDCALFIPVISASTASRHEGYFRLEWDLADQRTHRMARDCAFIVPVCLDATPGSGTDVPESFHRVQWTRLPGGETPPEFTARITHLLSPEPSHTSGTPPLPAGLVSNSAATARKPSPSRLFWPWNPVARVIVAGFVCLMLAYLIDKFWISKHPPAPQAVTAPDQTVATGGRTAPTIAQAVPPVAAPAKSIAVLPFLDMSEKHDQEYFSDGLTEELIDQLAHAPDLKVIARTSCFYFKGKQATIAEIAKTLGVSHVLEGSVRKSGKALRITAQLIRASDGVHVWSQAFDRNLVDIFRVQTELAGTVAKALEVALDMGERNSGVKESTPEAYALRLEADFVSRRATKADTERAIGLYRKALALDPRYAHAWANLGSTYLNLLNYGMVGSESIAAIIARARDALNHALRFDPNLGAAYRLKGAIAFNVDWNWPGAEAAFLRAGELDPSFHAEPRIASIWQAYGRVGESIEAFQRALSRDPISTGILWGLGWSYLDAARFDEAAATFRRISELVPSYASSRALEAAALLLQGKKEQALDAVEQEPDEAWKISISPIVYWDLGRKRESDAALRQLEEKFAASSAYNIAQMHAYRDEVEAAFRWLERAYRQRDPGMTLVKPDPLLRNLHGDARFQEMLVKMKLDGEGPEIRH